MISIVRTGVTPTLPDFITRLLEHLLVSGVLPLNQILDDSE
jgi:hypothetical protein